MKARETSMQNMIILQQGAFYVNSHNLKTMTRDIVATITLHEALPGHHLQSVVNDQAEDLPEFVRNYVALPGDIPSTMPSYMYVAFKEGWGLYSEVTINVTAHLRAN